MKRKLISLLLALTAALALAVPTAADVIWEPDDSFYERHRDECTYENRRYELAGYGDSVKLWSAPGGMVKEELPNGEMVRVQFRWSGSIDWGYVYGLSDDWSKGGWVPMDDLTLVYDSQAFMADHEAELVHETPAVDFHSAVLYDYPGGPAGIVLNEEAQYMSFSETFYPTYTDENGLRWGYVGYYMGRREAWVCLDDPMNEHLDTNIVEVAPSAAQLRGSETVSGGLSIQLVIAAALVVLVGVVTLLVIRKVRPKKK